MARAGHGPFPDAPAIARAIVEACRLFGEDPEAMARGDASRARHVALDALLTLYPAASRVGLARCLGYRNPKNGASQLTLARRPGWMSEIISDVVLGALVADSYGARAA